MRSQFLFCVIVVLFAQFSFGDVIPSDESQDIQNSKHEDLPESSPSSPPLATDDPGTPGPFGVEVNLFTELDSFKDGKNSSTGIDANLGLGETIQLRLSKEMTKADIDNQPSLNGHTATSLGLKWRFYDDKSLKFAFYPSYQFDDATIHDEDVSEGRSLYIPIIISKNFGLYTLVANLGPSNNLDHSEKWEVFSSLALGRAFSETLRLMTEVTSVRTTDGASVNAKLGFVKEIFPNEKSKYETGFFGSVGHSIGWTEDNKEHLSLLVGIAIARKPNE